MATFTFLQPFGTYVPNTFIVDYPDTQISTHSDTEMAYTSLQGYAISFQGLGFDYDDDFSPFDGAVSDITISLGGNTFAEFTGLDAGLQRLWNLATGIPFGPFSSPADTNQLYQILLRGNDSVVGSGGQDELTGGFGNDTVSGGNGRDVITADAGNDVLSGGDGRDTLSFNASYSDFTAFRGIVLNATTGRAIDCWGGEDSISGFEVFQDSVFNDSLIGSAADERFFLTRGNDRADAMDGFDILSFENAEAHGASHGVSVNLATGLVRDAWGGTDHVSNFEHVRGTTFADSITGSGADEEFVGGGGIDVIRGGAGYDIEKFFLADGVGHGARVDMTKAVNVLDDGFGNAETAIGIEGFDGTIYNDKLIGSSGANRLTGGDDGDDTLIGGGGADTLGGGTGNDSLSGGAGADQFLFQAPPPDAGQDRITDMAVGIDKIAVTLDWGGGLSSGALVAGQFLSGVGATQTTSTEQRFVYNTTTGDLYYDADGLGGNAGIKFAVLVNHAVITFGDILVIG